MEELDLEETVRPVQSRKKWTLNENDDDDDDDVGIGSNSHCLVGDWRMSLEISTESVVRNSRKDGWVTDG